MYKMMQICKANQVEQLSWNSKYCIKTENCHIKHVKSIQGGQKHKPHHFTHV